MFFYLKNINFALCSKTRSLASFGFEALKFEKRGRKRERERERINSSAHIAMQFLVVNIVTVVHARDDCTYSFAVSLRLEVIWFVKRANIFHRAFYTDVLMLFNSDTPRGTHAFFQHSGRLALSHFSFIGRALAAAAACRLSLSCDQEVF